MPWVWVWGWLNINCPNDRLFGDPPVKRFTVRRIVGTGDLWVTEFVLAYDGRPSYSVSVMEFVDGKVARETRYFVGPFEPGPSRAQWVERIG